MAFGFGAGVQRLGSVAVDTVAALNPLTPAADVRPTGFVFADPTPALNGVYTWSSTAWVRQRGLPDGVALPDSRIWLATTIAIRPSEQKTTSCFFLETAEGHVPWNGAPDPRVPPP